MMHGTMSLKYLHCFRRTHFLWQHLW